MRDIEVEVVEEGEHQIEQKATKQTLSKNQKKNTHIY